MKILFINACVRREFRTLKLANHLLEGLEGEVKEVNLEQEHIEPLRRESLERRDQLVLEQDYSDEIFKYARDFALADEIVVAAPFWDFAFPAILKTYLEAVTVSGLTFQYVDGIPSGMCRARRFIYVTTAGGPIIKDFGYTYAEFLAKTFFGIEETVCFRACNLDVVGEDIEVILRQTKNEIDQYLMKNR